MVCKCLRSKNTAESIQLQIVRALLAIVASPSSSSRVPVHLSALLYAVRTMYNVYLLSRNVSTQTIAQGALAQTVHVVFERVPLGCDRVTVEGELCMPSHSVTPAGASGTPARTPSTFRGSYDDVASANSPVVDDEVNDMAVRDAFLVFRSLCKISMKDVSSEEANSNTDLNSMPIRTRALALHLINMVLVNHIDVFTNSFVYLRFGLSIEGNNAGGEQSGRTREQTVSSTMGSASIVSAATERIETAAAAAADAHSDPASLNEVVHARDVEEMADNARATIKASQAAAERLNQEGSGQSLPSSPTLPSSRHEAIAEAEREALLRRGAFQQPSLIAVPFIAVVKQYLSLSLSRNLVSSAKTILGSSLSVFERSVLCLREYFKHECEQIFKEIILPVLELRYPTTPMQRDQFLLSLKRIFSDPQLVVELYLNYDCDNHASVNVFERLAQILSRLSGVVLDKRISSVSGGGSLGSRSASEHNAGTWGLARAQRTTVFNNSQNTASHAERVAATARVSASSLSPLSSPTLGEGAGQSQPSLNHAPPGPLTGGERAGTSSSALVIGDMPAYTGGLHRNLGVQAVIAQASSSNIDDHTLRQHSLEALTTMLQSMVAWGDIKSATNKSIINPEGVAESSTNGQDPDQIPGQQQLAPVPADEEGTNHYQNSASMTFSSGVNVGTSTKKDDDPRQLQFIKQRKERLSQAIQIFNFKPKKGIELLLEGGFIKSRDPKDIAEFLLTSTATLGIDKMQLGEYLGEGDQFNVSVMHAFVDLMDFADMEFVAALRSFLQTFRLPGEAQKIDRFMLKFAERYVMGNSRVFANADAAYVLAYSVILLNTDQHSAQIKRRMTVDDFISNNRGINDSKDLPREFLVGTFEEISRNEIVLKDDPLGESGGSGSRGRVATQQHLAEYRRAAQAMGRKAEESILRIGSSRHRLPGHDGAGAADADDSRNDLMSASMMPPSTTLSVMLDVADFTRASRAEHIMPMFGAIWAPVLAALSSAMQTSSDPHVVMECLVGFQCGIAISCRFRMDIERAAFVTTLVNFTSLNNLSEMGPKNVEAVLALLEVVSSRADIGDGLCGHWLDVLRCVSQVERLQRLIENPLLESMVVHEATRGTREGGEVMIPATVLLSSSSSAAAAGGKQSVSMRRNSIQSTSAVSSSTILSQGGSLVKHGLGPHHIPLVPLSKLLALGIGSQALVVAIDRIFTSSVLLSGAGITDFVVALSQVSWDEIVSSTDLATGDQHPPSQPTKNMQSTPRMFSLQKIVEISYYNMGRIRVEWTQVWAILGTHFNRAGTHPNPRIAAFTIDSLRQLSLKFLEKDELPHFQFQKDFLRPFAYIMENSGVYEIKDMVIQCILQLVRASATRIRSGWKAVLYVGLVAARDCVDSIADMGFRLVKECANKHTRHMWQWEASDARDSEGEHTVAVAMTGAEYYNEMINCLNEYVMISDTRPRLALLSLNTMRELARQVIAEISEAAAGAHHHNSAPKLGMTGDTADGEDPYFRVLTPLFRALHEVIMTANDLEVRTQSLDLLFGLIKDYGSHLTPQSWSTVLSTRVFSIFEDLQNPQASYRFATIGDLELWFSTTLMKALRHLVDLMTRYYTTRLCEYLPDVLQLLRLCIMQPSKSLIEIGIVCLQELIECNYQNFGSTAWDGICELLVELFQWSQPSELLRPIAVLPSKAALASSNEDGEDERGKSISYSRIKLKCLLQLQLIKLIDQLLSLPQAAAEAQQPYGSGLFSNSDPVYASLPPDLSLAQLVSPDSSHDIAPHVSSNHILCLLDCLEQSRNFAHSFNCNIELRHKLVELGIVPQTPSLLKQETSSALTLLRVLGRLYLDALYEGSARDSAPAGSHFKDRQVVLEEIEDKLFLLMRTVLNAFNGLASLPTPASLGSPSPQVAQPPHVTIRWPGHKLTLRENASDQPSAGSTAHELLQHPKYRREWRSCAHTALSLLPHLALANNRDVSKARDASDTGPFKRIIHTIYPELICCIGAAAEDQDLELVGWSQ
ncbi:guanine nucleotide exchange protein for ADP-robosylation factor, partial [Spiromyces aspiralis]